MKKLITVIIICAATIALAQDNGATRGNTGARRGGIGRGGAGGFGNAGAPRGRRRGGQQQMHKYQGLALTPPMGLEYMEYLSGEYQ